MPRRLPRDLSRAPWALWLILGMSFVLGAVTVVLFRAAPFSRHPRETAINGVVRSLAEELDLPLGTVKSRVRLAMQKLQLMVEK